jgi:phage-related protein
MPLKVGSLFVSLSADTGAFLKSMQPALKSVEKFSREVKKAANDAAQVAGSITTVGAAALKLASDVSGPTKAAMTELSLSMKQAAKPVAEALVPAVKEAAALLRGMGRAFSELSPETKAMVGDIFKAAAAVTAVSLVVGRLATLAGTLSGVFSGVAGAIAAIGVGPLLAVLAVIAAVAAGIAVLHRAWRENWGGMQQVVQTVAQWFADTWSTVTSFVTGLFSDMVDGLAGSMKLALNVLATGAEAMGQKDLGRALRGSVSVVDAIAKDLKSGAAVKRIVVAAIELGKNAADGFKERIFDELGILFGKLKQKFGSVPLTVGPLTVGPRRPLVSGAVVEGNMMGLAGRVDASNAAARRAVNPELRGPRRLSQTTAVKGEDARRNFEAFQEAQKQAAVEAAEATKGSLVNTTQAFVAKLGEAGSIINNVVNAAAQGGPWAAVAAAMAELLAQTQAFSRVVNVAGGGLKTVAEALQPGAQALFDALSKVLAPAFQVVATAMTAISPILESVAQVLEMVAPIVMLLVPVIRSLQPLLQFLADVLKFIFAALEPVFRIIFAVVQGIMLLVTVVQRAIVGIWNGLLEAIASIVDAVVALFTAGIVSNGGDFIRAGKGSVAQLDASLAELSTIDYDAAKAAAARAAADMEAKGATDDATKSMREFAQSFTNVPSGFKVAAAQFAADAAGYSPGGFTGGGGVIINGDIVITGGDTQSALEAFWQQVDRREFRSTGFTGGSVARNLR